MLTLGIETSCDETAAAVLKDGSELLSNIIASQDEIHSKYGGIVPELAGRCHIERIDRVIEEALDRAGVTLNEIDLIGVTHGPGLVVSLLVGVNTAKSLAYATGIPLIPINHLEGHLLAIFLQEPIPFPYLALAVSGGHTDLYRVDGFGQYQVLGRTRDDAAGESFDKVAKMLGMGYPGGPLIEKLGQNGNPEALDFPRAMLEEGNLDFSFSGLKTSVRRYLEKQESNGGSGISKADIAASFQEAVVDVLARKCGSAACAEGLERIVVTGGVAANSRLRQRVQEETDRLGLRCAFPKPIFCTDNAAMIACAAYHRFQSDSVSISPFSLDASASLPV